MKKKLLFSGLIILLILTWQLHLNAGIDAGRIMLENYNINKGKDSTAAMKMELIDDYGKKETSELSMWTLTGDAVKTLVRFNAPEALKGLAFLAWQHRNKDNDQWLYLPGFKKASRITGAMKAQSFAGSDFFICDIAPPHPGEFTHKLLGEEKINGNDCYRIESIHKTYTGDPAFASKKKYAYSKQISWIRRDNYVMVKGDAYDDKGNPCKEFNVIELKNISGIWTMIKMEMDNLKKHHRSIMTITDIKYNTGLKDSFFSVEQLEKPGGSSINHN